MGESGERREKRGEMREERGERRVERGEKREALSQTHLSEHKIQRSSRDGGC